MTAQRWREQYTNSLLSTDIFDIDTIHNLKGMRLLFDLLRHRVGSPISYLSLARDIGVSPTTIKKYIEILEAIYVVFKVTPFSRNIARSLLKEPKIYFFDTGLVQGDIGAKLENLVAVSLLKHMYAKNDALAEKNVLHYLRTKDGVEVDFALVKDGEVEKIIEVKHHDTKTSSGLRLFHQKYQYPAIQLVGTLRYPFTDKSIDIFPAEQYLEALYL